MSRGWQQRQQCRPMFLVFRNMIFVRRVCIVPPPNNIPCPLCGVKEAGKEICNKLVVIIKLRWTIPLLKGRFNYSSPP